MTEPTKLPVKTEKVGDLTGRRDWAVFDRLRTDVDRLLEQFGAGLPWRLPGRLALPEMGAEWRAFTSPLTPAVDIVEQPNAFEITAELPGMDDKDIEVKVVNGALVIKGEKRTEKEKSEGDVRVSERRFGSYERSFMLPDGVDPAKIEATFAKGVLTVTMPKTAEASKETKIPVKAA
jgi:HSP20 family protein